MIERLPLSIDADGSGAPESAIMDDDDDAHGNSPTMQLVKTAMVTGKRTVLLFAPQTPLVALETSARATLGEGALIDCHRFVA